MEKLLPNLKCYEDLVEQIKGNDSFLEEAKIIRDSKKIGKFDPITVSQEFRLIDIEELSEILDSNWIFNCKPRLDKEQDLRGIRIIEKEILIIEIDEFERHTITDANSSVEKIEFHRLIISDKEIDKAKFSFGKEYLVWQDTIKSNWIYEVTQMNSRR